MARTTTKLETLAEYFANITPGKKAIAKRLIDREAFLLAQMKELEAQIKKEGVKETYQNGNNQFGYKESTEFKCYIAMQKNYIAILKQLTEILPEEAAEELDEFEKIVGI